MTLLKLMGIDTDIICNNLAEKIRPTNLPEYIIFSDKKTGDVVDVCTINYRQTGTMSPKSYFVDSLKLAVSKNNVSNYTSLTRHGETYAKESTSYHECDRISKERFNRILERTDRFEHLNLEKIE